MASIVNDSVDTSTTLARNRFTASMTWPRVVASARTLTSASSRDTRIVLVLLDDLDHVDQLVELLGDLFERRLVDADHDGHPRHVLLLGGADRERLDVVAAPREQRCHSGEHAGLVLDEHRQGVCWSRATHASTPTRSGPRSYLAAILTRARLRVTRAPPRDRRTADGFRGRPGSRRCLCLRPPSATPARRRRRRSRSPRAGR